MQMWSIAVPSRLPVSELQPEGSCILALSDSHVDERQTHATASQLIDIDDVRHDFDHSKRLELETFSQP